MKIEPFAVEQWMDEYVSDVDPSFLRNNAHLSC